MDEWRDDDEDDDDEDREEDRWCRRRGDGERLILNESLEKNYKK